MGLPGTWSLQSQSTLLLLLSFNTRKHTSVVSRAILSYFFLKLSIIHKENTKEMFVSVLKCDEKLLNLETLISPSKTLLFEK